LKGEHLSKLLLASESPRRKELLTAMGIYFEARPAGIDEDSIPADHPRTLAIRLAYAKAMAILAQGPEEPVFAADTVVALEGILYSKPGTAAQAREMLRNLSGREHEVITGVAIAMSDPHEVHLDSATTRVRFRSLSDEEIERYVATGEPMDKAGGYGIQGLGGDLIESIEGDYFNVVGLPCSLVAELLRAHTDVVVGQLPQSPKRWR
jgi:septum formation protein